MPTREHPKPFTKVIGARRKEGAMTAEDGREVVWDYVRLSIVSNNVPETYGLSAEVVKVKKEDFENFTGIEYKNYMQLVDKEVDLLYVPSDNKVVLVGVRPKDLEPISNNPPSSDQKK